MPTISDEPAADEEMLTPRERIERLRRVFAREANEVDERLARIEKTLGGLTTGFARLSNVMASALSLSPEAVEALKRANDALNALDDLAQEVGRNGAAS